jgi:hypothetical protein
MVCYRDSFTYINLLAMADEKFCIALGWTKECHTEPFHPLSLYVILAFPEAVMFSFWLYLKKPKKHTSAIPISIMCLVNKGEKSVMPAVKHDKYNMEHGYHINTQHGTRSTLWR